MENHLALSFVVLWRMKNYCFELFWIFFQWIFNTKYIPGAYHRPCLCIMTTFSLEWELQTSESLLASNRKRKKKRKEQKKTGDIAHFSSYPGLDDWELGQWCKPQSVSTPQLDTVDSLMWFCVQHINLIDSHSKTFNW